MSALLSNYINYFKDIFNIDKNEYNSTYHALDKESNKTVFLKIYDKSSIEEGPTDLLYKQIENEKTLTQLCKNDNIIELYKILETDISIIFVYELCDNNLLDYLLENGELNKNKEFFIKIVQSLAIALKVLNDKKIIHRDIKPNNIYIKKINNDNQNKNNIEEDDENNIEDNCIIKLADFGSSIRREENDSIQIGTLLYLAPEIIQNLDYDEKVDMWSLGITLYQLYFGFPPYGIEYDFNIIEDKILSNNFIFKFSEIPTLDILFKKLLTIDPKERMTHEEFYNFVLNKDFMKPNIIYHKEIYGNIYNEIQNIIKSKEYKNLKIGPLISNESNIPEIINEENMNKIVEFSDVFDIVYKYKKEEQKQNKKKKYNNILYYNEDKSHPKNLALEIEMFEKETTGTFFFINNIISLDYIMYEIYNQYRCNKKYSFNLIIPGSCFEKVFNSLKERYKECFNHICIFCRYIEKYLYLKENYNKITDIYKSKKDVIKEFIIKYSKENIQPFPVISFITYEEYRKKYFSNHRRISLFYGELSKDSYIENFNKIKQLIKNDKNDLYRKDTTLIKAFETFNISEDIKNVNQKIINEYTKNTFFGDLNRWLRILGKYSYEEVAYFTSRFMYSLNQYGYDKQKFYNCDNAILYRGAKLYLSSLLSYEKAKEKIIILTAFTSMSMKKEKAEKFAKVKNKDSKEFSVMFYITNLSKTNWISNGIDVHDISKYKKELEVLFHPFSFYIVKNVKINVENKTAEIYLETIGKKEILEEKIKNGYYVKYNKDLKIVESIITDD